MTKPLVLTSLLSLLATAALPAHAQSSDQRLWLRLGAFQPGIESTIQYNEPDIGLTGTELDLEKDLGLADRKTLPTLLIGGRLGERWRLEFEHFTLKRSATRVLDFDVTFGDTTYDAQAVINSDFSSKVYRLGLGYSFLRTEEAEAGITLGVHVTDFRVGLEGIGSVNGGASTTRRERQDKTIPLPTLGLYGNVVLAPGWEASARVDLLSLKVNDYKGRLLNAQANIHYRFTPNVALGLGYRYDDYDLRANRTDWTGKVDYQFKGPQVLLEAGF